MRNDDDSTALFRTRTLPVLASLAGQVLLMVVDATWSENAGGDLLFPSAYPACKRLFEETRQVYTNDLILKPRASHVSSLNDARIFALTNQATLFLDMVDTGRLSPAEMHDVFLDIFHEHSPGITPARILAEIKTQVFVSFCLNSLEPREDSLRHLFSRTQDEASQQLEETWASAGDNAELTTRREELESLKSASASSISARYPWSLLTKAIIEYLRNDLMPELLDAANLTWVKHCEPYNITGEEDGSKGRQLWTSEQEQTLLAALDEVKGSHWARILALHGKNGSKSKILAPKNQVQLKDKARNMKLAYIRAGKRVPPCLSFVSGKAPLPQSAK